MTKVVASWVVLALVLGAGAVYGSPGIDYFQAGNEAYEVGDFAGAVAHYDSAELYMRSANLYYNRGNAYFKLGALGRAVADYNRAYVLAPQDVDIRQNLQFVRAYRPDKTLVLPNPLVQLFTTFLRLVDLHTAKLTNGVLFFLALLAVAVGLGWRTRIAYGVGAGLGVLWLYTDASWLSWAAEVSPARAVVVESELTLRSGPGEEYKDLLVVHDGLEVLIRSRRGKYVLVQAPGGEGGWVEAGAVEQIFPRSFLKE